VSDIADASFRITAQGGQIEVFKIKHEEGKKISAAEFVKAHALATGTPFGT
jgi:methionyl-tRNA formyltransferase